MSDLIYGVNYLPPANLTITAMDCDYYNASGTKITDCQWEGTFDPRQNSFAIQGNKGQTFKTELYIPEGTYLILFTARASNDSPNYTLFVDGVSLGQLVYTGYANNYRPLVKAFQTRWYSGGSGLRSIELRDTETTVNFTYPYWNTLCFIRRDFFPSDKF